MPYGIPDPIANPYGVATDTPYGVSSHSFADVYSRANKAQQAQMQTHQPDPALPEKSKAIYDYLNRVGQGYYIKKGLKRIENAMMAAYKGANNIPLTPEDQAAMDDVLADMIPGGFALTFGGKLAKNADLKALAKAEMLKGKGADDATIWKDTGWWLGHPDGKPRFEINDEFVKPGYRNWAEKQDFDNQGYAITNRQGALLHPGISANYPDTKNIGVRLQADMQGGSYRPSPLEMIQSGADKGSGRANPSTMLHELQHAIQQREGFARGGSPSMFKKSVPDEMLAELKDAKLLKQMNGNVKRFKSYFGYEPSRRSIEIANTNSLKDLLSWYDEQTIRNLAPDEAYRRLAGEAEARNVQTRMNYSQAQRRATPPWETFDVPLDEQIVRFK